MDENARGISEKYAFPFIFGSSCFNKPMTWNCVIIINQIKSDNDVIITDPSNVLKL